MKFEMMRPVGERDSEALCPQCAMDCDRIISGFSFYAAATPNSFEKYDERMKERAWNANRKVEDYEKKTGNPLDRWRKEREQACGRGPEAWVEWAHEEKARMEKEDRKYQERVETIKEYGDWAQKARFVDDKEREFYKRKKEQEKLQKQRQEIGKDFDKRRKIDTSTPEEKIPKIALPTWGKKKKKDEAVEKEE
jgi:hypothetical protein